MFCLISKFIEFLMFMKNCLIQSAKPSAGQAGQQHNCSPLETMREVEDYDPHLDGVTALELWIMPDISGGNARATLAQLSRA